LGFCAYPNPIPLLPDIPDPLITPDGTAPCGGVKSCCVTINPLAEKVDITDRDKLINYSGPINKLLPQEVQQQARAQTVMDAVKSRNGDNIRHDQIVGCTYGFKIPIINKTLIGIPAPCYESGLLSLIPRNIHRLSEWENHIPPVRSDPKYKSSLEYQVAYSRWRGRSCAVVEIPPELPIIGKLPIVGGKGFYVCGDLVPGGLLHPNFFAQMYANIPMSSTEDLKGSIEVDKVSSATSPSQGGVKVTGVTFSNQKPAELFFSHMEETNTLANLLQDSYVSKDERGDKAGSPTNVTPPASCTTVDIRSNKGDDLFSTQIVGDLHYEANFTCEFNKIPTCSGLCFPNQRECYYAGGLPGTGDCLHGEYCCNIPGATPVPIPAQDCTKDVYISLSTSSNTPKVDDIWSRLVAGPQSVFKRIFPKTNTPGSVGKIIDIPGSTNITYTGLGISQQDTDLKFPHIGGISEYFLKGVQTALRPKGYGEHLSFADNDGGGGTGSINCNQNAPETAVTGLIKDEAERISDIWYGSGVGKAYFKECNNDVIQTANTRGINPLFTLAIWIHESGASNYLATTPVEDFGIHNDPSAPPNDFTAQLNAFLNLPDFYATCGTKNLDTFISMFWFGHCSPQNPDEESRLAQYISELQWIYSIIAPGVALPSWPK